MIRRAPHHRGPLMVTLKGPFESSELLLLARQWADWEGDDLSIDGQRVIVFSIGNAVFEIGEKRWWTAAQVHALARAVRDKARTLEAERAELAVEIARGRRSHGIQVLRLGNALKRSPMNLSLLNALRAGLESPEARCLLDMGEIADAIECERVERLAVRKRPVNGRPRKGPDRVLDSVVRVYLSAGQKPRLAVRMASALI